MRGYIEGYIDPFGSVYFLAKKKLSPRQPEEKLKRQRFITECEFIKFGKNKNTVDSKFYDFCSFQKQLIQHPNPSA